MREYEEDHALSSVWWWFRFLSRIRPNGTSSIFLIDLLFLDHPMVCTRHGVDHPTRELRLNLKQ